MTQDNLLLSTSQATVSSSAANVSLLKLGTLTQTIIGVVITGAVIAATVTTIALISVSVGVYAPKAVDDYVTAYKTTPQTLYVLANDNDPKGSNLTISAVTQPTYGVVSIAPNGRAILFQSNAYYAGPDMFNYTISNDKLTARASVFITVLNQDPVAPDFAFDINKNSQDNMFDMFNIKQNSLMISDLDNDLLSIADVTLPEHGSAYTNGTHVFYTPATNFNDIESFNYTVSDRNTTATGVITITIINNPPVANPIALRVPKNVVQVFNVIELGNIQDANYDNITLVSLGSCLAVVEISDEQNVRYLPTATTDPYNDSFEYTVTDGLLTATSYVTIQMYNTPPIAYNTTLVVKKNSEGNRVLLGMSDADILDSLKAVSTPAASKGSVVFEQTTKIVQKFFADNWYGIDLNSFTAVYNAPQGFVGEDVIQFTATDGYDQSTGFVTVTVYNEAPVAVDDSTTCSKSQETVIDVVSNDSDPNNDELRLIDFTPFLTQLGGTVERVSDTEVLYKAPKGVLGTDTFQYTIADIQENDSDALTATATVSVSLYNEPPVAHDDSEVVGRNFDVVIDVLSNDVDPNGDKLTITALGSISSGTITVVTVDDKDYVKFEASSDIGTFSVDYTIEDENGENSTATISIAVVNTPPVPVNDNIEVLWNRVVTFDVIANDTDANGDPITIYDYTNPSHGVISLSADKKSFNYIPAYGFVGTDSFTYRNFDNFDYSTTSATVTINVINNPPETESISLNTHWTTPVVGNFYSVISDVDGDSVSVIELGTPSSGSAEIISSPAGASVRYTPSAVGVFTFNYVVTDGNLNTTDTVTVTVTNNRPVAVNDAASFHWKTNSIVIQVLENDYDDDSEDTVSLHSIVEQPSAGTAAVEGSTIRYTIDSDSSKAIGEFTIKYHVYDGVQTSANSATVTVKVTNDNTPTAADFTSVVHWREFTNLDFAVTSSMSDADGDAYSATVTSNTVGFLVQTIDNSPGITFRLNAPSGWSKGAGSIQYSVSDGIQSASGLIDITVYNTAPTAGNFSAENSWAVLQNGLTFNVLTKADDADVADKSFLSIVTLGKSRMHAQATAEITADQKIFYKPAANTVGTDIIAYTVSDGLDTATGYINVTVTSLTLSTSNQFYSTHWRSTPLILDLIEKLDFSDSSALELVTPLTQNPDQGGAVTLSGTQSVSYTQSSGFLGTETFKIDYEDTVGGSTNTITVTVEVTNTEPVAQSQTFTVHRLKVVGGYAFNASAYSSDADGDSVTITSAAKVSPTQGTVSLSGSIVTYTPPAASFIGNGEKFGYTVSDGVESKTGYVVLNIYNTVPVTTKKTISTHWRNLIQNGFTINVLTGDFTGNSAAVVSDYDIDAGDTLTVTSIDTTSLVGATATRASSSSPTVNFKLDSTSQVNTALSFTYVVTDGASNGQANPTLVQVTGTNTAPTVQSFSVQQHWATPTFDIELSTRIVESDAADVSFLTITDVSSQFATVIGTKIRISKTVSASDIGVPFTVSYKAYDGSLKSNTGVITITYIDSAPVASGISGSIRWNDTYTVPLLTRCVDSDDTVSVSKVNGVNLASISTLNSNSLAQTTIKGSLTLTSSGTASVRYAPSATIAYPSSQSLAKSAVSTWTFTCYDGLLSSDGTVTVTVTNTQPTATDKVITLYRSSGSMSYTISNFLPAQSTDVDGDIVTLANLANAVVANGGTDVVITMDTASQTSKQFTYQLFDGQLYSNVATVTVNWEAQPPSCIDKSVTIYKGASTSFVVTDLCTDPNGLSMTFNLPTTSVGSVALTSSSTVLTYTAPVERSGVVTLPYTVKDALQSTTKTITITILNRAPSSSASTWSIAGSRNTNVATLTKTSYLTQSAASDVDTYDNTRLSIVSVTPVTCNNPSTIGAFAVDSSGNIVFTRVYSFSGSCTVNVVIQDADANSANVLTSTSTMTVQVSTQGLVAVGRTISVQDAPGVMLLSDSEITINDYDPLNGTFTLVGFIYDTETCAMNGFCSRTEATPVRNGDKWQFLTQSANCQLERFKYKIQSIQDPTKVAYAVLNIEYTACSCSVPMDVVIAFDSSGSVGADNFLTMKNFAKSLISNFVFANEGSDSNANTKMGVVRFSSYSDISTITSMTGDKQTVLDGITNMYYDGGNTWILDGIRRAEAELNSGGRSSVKNKVIIVLFDGEPNGPCSCSACRDRYSGTDSSREEQCKSVRYPFRTCNPCDLNYNYDLKCMPCSDIVPLCKSINSRRPDIYGNMPDGYWRVIPVGIGQALSNPDAQQLLKDMSYDPNRSFYVDWDQLESLYTTVSSQTCNLVSVGDLAPMTYESTEPDTVKCGDIVSIRARNSYLTYVSSAGSYSNILTVSDTTVDPNTPGQTRASLWQIVCPGGSYGTTVTYGSTIALWNLQTKNYAKRIQNTDSSYITLAGTQTEVNNNSKGVRWIVSSNGYSTSGKVFLSNNFCLGSNTRTSSQILNVATSWPTASTSCETTRAYIYTTTYHWRDLNNKNGISFSDFPQALPESERN